VELIHAPCVNGVLKVGVKALDLCGAECVVHRLWFSVTHKKAMVELVRPNEEYISMSLPAIIVKMLDYVVEEVSYFDINTHIFKAISTSELYYLASTDLIFFQSILGEFSKYVSL
jgi:hypothetical protein